LIADALLSAVAIDAKLWGLLTPAATAQISLVGLMRERAGLVAISTSA